MFMHTSIMFKKKWKPAELGNTGQGERTHVRAKWTESMCDFQYMRMNTRTEKKIGLRTVPVATGTMAGSYGWTPILFRAWIHFFTAVVQCPLWPSYGWQVWLTILCEIHRILECIALHTRRRQAAIYFVIINEVFQLKILPHLGSWRFKLRATPGPDDIFQSINIQTMVFLCFSVLQNISRLLKLQKIALRAFI